MMRCPQCGLENDDGTVICAGCDHILDTSFLGADVLGGGPPLGDDMSGPPTLASEQTGSFLTSQTSLGLRLIEPEPFATAEASVLFDRDAVLAVAPGVDIAALGLSPFESHVITFIDGQRPVARLRGLAGVGPEDLRICLGMLSDRGVLVRVGTARAVVDEDEKTGEISLEGVMPIGMLGEPEPRTDAVLIPEDLLSDDDDAVPVVTPLPVNFHAGIADLAAVALDFVDDESPMTLEPGASPFGAAQVQPAAKPQPVVSAPLRMAVPTSTMPPPPASRSGAPPLPGMSPAPRSGVIPPLPGKVPARAASSGVPPMPGAGPVRAAMTSGEGAPVMAPSTPGIRPSLRAPGAPMVAGAPASRTPEPVAADTPPTSGPIMPRRAPTQEQIQARQAYELALKDLKDNKMARALTYARAARDLDPENDLYKELLDNWGRQRSGGPMAPSGPKR